MAVTHAYLDFPRLVFHINCSPTIPQHTSFSIGNSRYNQNLRYDETLVSRNILAQCESLCFFYNFC